MIEGELSIGKGYGVAWNMGSQRLAEPVHRTFMLLFCGHSHASKLSYTPSMTDDQ